MISPHQLPFKLNRSLDKDRIQVIRVNETDEVPQHRVNPHGEEKENFRSGLFIDKAGIYYSLEGRPDTMRFIYPTDQKFKNQEKFLRQPRLVEFIPLGKLDKHERDEFTKIAHKMRRLNIVYYFLTILPYPLHIIRSLEKYLSFIDSSYIACEFEDDIKVPHQLELPLEF